MHHAYKDSVNIKMNCILISKHKEKKTIHTRVVHNEIDN